MNARRRTVPDGLPNRVYIRSGSYYWARPDGKWLKLARVSDGEVRMLQRLAEEKRDFEPKLGNGNVPRLVGEYMDTHKAKYAESYRDEWARRGDAVVFYFRDWNVERIDAGDVEDFLTANWPEKLPMQRAMKAWLSKFFNWIVRRKKLMQVNPCREVVVKKPKVRDVYIPDRHFVAIREALMSYEYKKDADTPNERIVIGKVPTGPMMQCFVDLCYLTCQRSTEIRLLRWDQIDREAGVIHFVPTKTEDSSGEAVDWPLTPDIEAVLARAKLLDPAFGQTYVIRDKKGNPKTDQACRDAWDGAVKRAAKSDPSIEGKPYTIKDIRAKALTDAKRAGYAIEELRVAGAHTDTSTTETYIKSREVPRSNVVLHLPARKSA
ncbi:tyrosine-type recombinase/integrase [Burkholderia multivorans]|nr:tyrosine-type recombinase/integrase [Burkholderia multivorans]MCA8260864.1 tyrosine-type recombinase/integrase [Burkholderia multivorans]MCO8609673.1 tyrosine-type recombinase/integrase [Burkholderia multivorans]MCO8638298.1 tyrosine-type recombinase/integrase [Burkholderia multivorans]MCO8644522.1 tyrosine-type recombinase/integrase [Burkholderia multivorans]MDN7985684.1 tyrosine-type recombinase/integrase [Burkholderia multivorans]